MSDAHFSAETQEQARLSELAILLPFLDQTHHDFWQSRMLVDGELIVPEERRQQLARNLFVVASHISPLGAEGVLATEAWSYLDDEHRSAIASDPLVREELYTDLLYKWRMFDIAVQIIGTGDSELQKRLHAAQFDVTLNGETTEARANAYHFLQLQLFKWLSEQRSVDTD